MLNGKQLLCHKRIFDDQARVEPANLPYQAVEQEMKIHTFSPHMMARFVAAFRCYGLTFSTPGLL